jgi:hypothetical protein
LLDRERAHLAGLEVEILAERAVDGRRQARYRLHEAAGGVPHATAVAGAEGRGDLIELVLQRSRLVA